MVKNNIIVGSEVSLIELTNKWGDVQALAKISTADVPKVVRSGLHWKAAFVHGGRYVRVLASVTRQSATATVHLPRFLLDAPAGLVVDHINHDTLDNRRENLRIVTQSENLRNRRDYLARAAR